MSVLYRKYRPKSFSDLKGQNTIKDILTYSIKNKSFSHGYLFSGPRGTGKTTTARLFARAINDKKFSDTEDIGEYLEDSIDIIEMDAASNRGIDEIRELRDSIQYLPVELDYKVYIIDEAHMLTKEAFNALLKTLEEPPKHVIFILATTEPHKVPVTILSRVTRLDFKLATENQLIEKINVIAKSEGLDISEDALKQIFKISGGSFRDAESVLAKLIQLNEEKIDLDTVNSVFGLLPKEEIERAAEAISLKDLEKAKEIISEIEDSNIEYFVEGLLEFIVDSEEYTELIEPILDVYKNLKYFKDKKIYLLAKLINFAVLKDTFRQASTLSAIAKREAATEVKTSDQDLPQPKADLREADLRKAGGGEVGKKEGEVDSNVVGKKETHQKVEKVDNADIINSLSSKIESDNKRLATIVRTCGFGGSDGTKVTFTNKYKFNISYLSQNKKLILEKLKSISEYTDIEFINGGETIKKVTPTRVANARVAKEKAEEVGHDSEYTMESGEPLPEPPGDIDNSSDDFVENIKENEGIDNSDLVESIL